ncbi:MAG TPA: nucleotidyltransferase family protein [bacterium]|nr:nucleotidyltransferase family protein [bacterium]
MIAALVLAAGRAVRMGSPKLLLPVGGEALLARVLRAARASRCDDVLVVVGAGAEDITAAAREAGARAVLNPRYAEGMGTSVAAGIAALPDACEAVVVMLGDQPFVGPEIINALIDAHRDTGRPLVASRYGTVRGAPMLIGRDLFDEARALDGDVGARVLLRGHPDLLAEVDVGEGPASWDVDTPDDLERVRRADGGADVPGARTP